jgi:hypothetical protein
MDAELLSRTQILEIEREMRRIHLAERALAPRRRVPAGAGPPAAPKRPSGFLRPLRPTV